MKRAEGGAMGIIRGHISTWLRRLFGRPRRLTMPDVNQGDLMVVRLGTRDGTGVVWDGVETDASTLARVVLNETDPIVAMVRGRMTREPRRDDIERGGASRPEKDDHE